MTTPEEAKPNGSSAEDVDIEMIQVRMIPPIFIASMDDGIAYASVTDGHKVIAFPVARTTMRLVEAFMQDEDGKCGGESKLDGRSAPHFRDAVAVSTIAKPIGIELEVDKDKIAPFLIHITDTAVTLTPISLNMMLSLHVTCGVPIIMRSDAFEESSIPIPDEAVPWRHTDQSSYYMKIIGPRLPKVDIPTDLPEGLAVIFDAARSNRDLQENQNEAPAATA